MECKKFFCVCVKAPSPDLGGGQNLLSGVNRLFCIHFFAADLVIRQKVIHVENLYVNLLVNTWENWTQVRDEV